MRSAPAIAFEFRTSRVLMAATIIAGLLAIFAVWVSGGPLWLRSALILIATVCGGAAFGRMLRPRVRSLLWRTDGSVELTLNDTLTDGRRETQGAIRDARVMGPLIVLTLRWPPRERATLWLLPDNLDADTRRRLRMRLAVDAGGLASGNPDSR